MEPIKSSKNIRIQELRFSSSNKPYTLPDKRTLQSNEKELEDSTPILNTQDKKSLRENVQKIFSQRIEDRFEEISEKIIKERQCILVSRSHHV